MADGFGPNVLSTGDGNGLGIHSGTVKARCEQYAKARAGDGVAGYVIATQTRLTGCR
jgi:hypothetical protein